MIPRLPRIWMVILSSSTIVFANTIQDGHHQKLQELCSEDSPYGAKCKIYRSKHVICRGNALEQLSTKEKERTKTLVLCHWNEVDFDPDDILSEFPRLKKFEIHGGNITKFVSAFPAVPIEILILKDLQLTGIELGTFSNLDQLEILDLSGNQLRGLDRKAISSLPSEVKIHLIGNPWHCSTSLLWILDEDITNNIVDIEDMICHSPYPHKPARDVMELIQGMINECPNDICECTMQHIVWDTDRRNLHPLIAVNCSHQNLQEMPQSIPQNTTTLYLSHNNISDLSPLTLRKAYDKVADIYLDYNSITTIEVLEDAKWLRQFRILSLRHNLISEVRIYKLDLAFNHNSHLLEIYLGDNPWNCVCDFTPAFQYLLIKFGVVIRDLEDIKCANDYANMQVMEVPRNWLCNVTESQINPLDILSAIFAFLIVTVLGKLVYDYWNFKKTGKLPWIVTKMP